MKKLRPPVHFMRTASFKVQIGGWDSQRLGDALDLLLETERQYASRRELLIL